MARYFGLTKKNAHRQHGKTGVLLINLGTPQAPTPSALRRYLAEFLADSRVVEIPKLLWLAILHGIILRIRPKKSARLYEKIWTDKGSPLLAISQQQRQCLQQKLEETHPNVSVHLAMRYGKPGIVETLRQMHEAGIDKMVILPLYPQYAAPTTASSFDAISSELRRWRYVPSIHFINSYHEHPDFIEALVDSITRDISHHGKPQKLVFSYHGMPERNLHLGDPYYCFCMKTTRLVAEKMALAEGEFMVCFQSRFGKAKWLTPYTDVVLNSLPAEGVTDVAMICPAFSADCLETLEEIALQNKEVFIEAGGKDYRYIPALNDDELHIKMMANLVAPYI